jgi:hypothetical protein
MRAIVNIIDNQSRESEWYLKTLLWIYMGMYFIPYLFIQILMTTDRGAIANFIITVSLITGIIAQAVFFSIEIIQLKIAGGFKKYL